ncbi:protein kinase [Myxococcus sp. CA033]|nr:serine/threonine-protein kinase [Myxococcus sp. CA033]NTX38147.1 protein kinase [Myxococcus sp. CA033]
MSGTTLPLAPDASKGRSLGKYEVLSRLSTGGMAEIFLASQRGLAGFRKLVVLKQILPDIRGEEEFIRMFLDEAKVTAAFNHPHIAQVFDLDIAEGELFLAMEFVPGATLVEVARACRQASHPIPVGFSLMAVRDTAVALHYAHTFTDPLGHPSPVIHRDVAEKNIMVTYEGVTKLLDFGIAKSLARASRTAVGMVKGTSGYMSPEQIMGEPLDARSDLFSLGVVLHELLTGMRLFYAKQAEAMMNAVLKCEVTPPSRANKQIPPELDAIVLRALSKRREDRYASTLEFARALERAVGPLIWHPEQSSEVMRRLFADRREQTRQLLIAGPTGDTTGETSVAAMLAMGGSNSVPEAPEPPTVNTNSGPPDSPPSRRSAVATAAKQPAPAATPRRATSMQPATTPPPPPDPQPRKAVLQAPPHKRLAGRGAPSESARPPPPPPPDALPPPPPQEAPHLARTLPGRPALPPSGHTVRAPAPAPRAVPVPEEPVPRSEARPRTGRTVDTLRAVAPPPQPPERNEETAMVRVPSLSAEPGSHAGVPSRRAAGAARRRPQPQLPAAFPDAEVTTRPSRGFQENRRKPDDEVPDDEDSHVHTLRGVPAVGSESRGGRKVLAGVLVLVAVAAAVVGLGLDGGVVSAWAAPLLGLEQKPPPPAPLGDTDRQRVPLPREQTKAPPVIVPPVVVEKVPPPPEVLAETVDPDPEPSNAPPTLDEVEDKPARKPGRSTGKRTTKESTTRNGKRATFDSGEDSAATPTGEPGFLTLVTEPYAKVYLGGQSLGDTPLFKVSLPSGKHTLKLVDGDGKALKLSVDIKPGDTTAVRVPLEMLSRQ